jgi:hypothetical protein
MQSTQLASTPPIAAHAYTYWSMHYYSRSEVHAASLELNLVLSDCIVGSRARYHLSSTRLICTGSRMRALELLPILAMLYARQ